jgi:hypothetical protein
MLAKVVIIFLLAMVLLGMVGKWLFPGTIRRAVARRAAAVKCPKCGRFLMGRRTCDCGHKG